MRSEQRCLLETDATALLLSSTYFQGRRAPACLGMPSVLLAASITQFDAEHEEPVCFYYDVRIDREATKHDCQYSTIGEAKDWIAAYERRLARRAARAARGGVDSETDESDDGL